MEYRYGGEERVYVDRALVVSDGDIVDWPDGPPADGHWEPAAPQTTATPSVPTATGAHPEQDAEATPTTEAPADAAAEHTEE